MLGEHPVGCGGEGGPWHLSVLEIGQFKTSMEHFIYDGKMGARAEEIVSALSVDQPMIVAAIVGDREGGGASGLLPSPLGFVNNQVL